VNSLVCAPYKASKSSAGDVNMGRPRESIGNESLFCLFGIYRGGDMERKKEIA
jgi:hypothetical protein